MRNFVRYILSILGQSFSQEDFFQDLFDVLPVKVEVASIVSLNEGFFIVWICLSILLGIFWPIYTWKIQFSHCDSSTHRTGTND